MLFSKVFIEKKTHLLYIVVSSSTARSICVFVRVVCFGLAFVYSVFYPDVSKGSQTHTCILTRSISIQTKFLVKCKNEELK